MGTNREDSSALNPVPDYYARLKTGKSEPHNIKITFAAFLGFYMMWSAFAGLWSLLAQIIPGSVWAEQFIIWSFCYPLSLVVMLVIGSATKSRGRIGEAKSWRRETFWAFGGVGTIVVVFFALLCYGAH